MKGSSKWDGWMASPTQRTWVWANSGRWWRTGKPGMLQSMGLQKVGHDLATEHQKEIIFPSPWEWKIPFSFTKIQDVCPFLEVGFLISEGLLKHFYTSLLWACGTVVVSRRCLRWKEKNNLQDLWGVQVSVWSICSGMVNFPSHLLCFPGSAAGTAL